MPIRIYFFTKRKKSKATMYNLNKHRGPIKCTGLVLITLTFDTHYDELTLPGVSGKVIPYFFAHPGVCLWISCIRFWPRPQYWQW